MILTWNGVPLLLPDRHGQLDQWLSQFHTIADVCQFCGIEPARVCSTNARLSAAGTGITSPNWPDLPPLAINELIMPTGAARFGYFVGLLPFNAESVGEPGSVGTLAMGDAENPFEVSLAVLAFRPLTCVQGSGQLGLLVLVDRRYAWQFYDCGNVLQENGFPLLEDSGQFSGTPNNDYGQNQITYSEVFLALEQRMGVEFQRDDAPGVVDSLELSSRKFFNAAVMLDAIAESCGLRVWIDWDGSVQIRGSSQNASPNFNDTSKMIAGGAYASPPKPAAVQVNFPRARYYRPYADADRYTITLDVAGGEADSSAITVDSCCYAHWMAQPDNYVNDPVNLATLNNIASNISSGVMGWWRDSYDATFLGVKEWQQTGFDNYVAISYARLVPNNVYNPAVERDRIPKADTKFDLNYRVFTTRAQSMPMNFGARVNFTQDETITFLRGWQWGKLNTASEPPQKNDSGQIIPKATLVTVWQLNAQFREQSTQIQIEAYDATSSMSVHPADSRVILFFREVNRAWYYQVVSDTSAQIVAVSSTSTATMIQKNPLCLWPGKLVTSDTDNTPCGAGFLNEGEPCWLVVMNEFGEVFNSLPNHQRYVGVPIGTYEVSGDSRPLYAIKPESRLVRFQLVMPLAVGSAAPSNNAVELSWSALTNNYQPTGNYISVVDPFQFTGGEFSGLGTNAETPGYRGWAEWKPDREIYEIVWMEPKARIIRFRINSGQSLTVEGESANVTVLNYCQGRNPGNSTTVYNVPVEGGYLYAAPSNAVGIAFYDDRQEKYFVQSVQVKPQFIMGKLTSTLSAEGAASASVTQAWGPARHVEPPATTTVRDRSDPKIFSGASGDQYQATYDAVRDSYNLTWVACQGATGATGA